MTTVLKECIFTSWEHRQAIWDWAVEHDITIEYQGTGADNGWDMWRIESDKDRAWFFLRWS